MSAWVRGSGERSASGSGLQDSDAGERLRSAGEVMGGVAMISFSGCETARACRIVL